MVRADTCSADLATRASSRDAHFGAHIETCPAQEEKKREKLARKRRLYK